MTFKMSSIEAFFIKRDSFILTRSGSAGCMTTKRKQKQTGIFNFCEKDSQSILYNITRINLNDSI